MKNFRFVTLLLLGWGIAHAQQPKNVQTSQAAATRGQITADLSFGTGRTGSFLSGSTLSIAGTLSGTPTGGTLNLSNLTLTLPASVSGLGSVFQAYDADLTTWAGITPSANVQSLVAAANYAAMRALLDLEAGTDFLALPTGTPTGSKFLRDDNSWQTIAGGGDALVASPLSQFAATTSAQLAGVISNETGSGALMFATNPTIPSHFDLTEIASPSNPSSGNLRIWAESIGGFGQLHFKNGAGLDHELGRDNLHTVRNNTGSTITKGSWVYINGSTGVYPTIALAKADSAGTLPAVGLVVADITTASFGQIMTHGDAQNINTSAFVDGDTLYASASVAGGATATVPTGANIVQRLGVVVNSSAGAGIVAVLIGGEDNPGITQTLSNKTLVEPIVLSPNAAMGALAIDVTKRRNTKTIAADSTLTFSATPSAGTIFGLRLTNSDSAVHTITIPSSFSYWRGTITTFIIPASSTVELSWDYNGTTYYIAGDPVTFNDLTTATPVAGDFVPFYDVSGAVDGKATIANLISPQIGVSVQAYDADLTTYAGITPAANTQSLLGAANYAAMRALLDLEAGTDFLAYPTGTPTGSKYLRDDNTWQTVSGSSAPTVNAQTGTTYTLVLGDGNNIVTMTNAAANTLTIPPNSSVAFATGTIIQVQQGGAGATTFDPGVGVTMNGATSNVTLSEQYEWATLVKLGTDAWGLSYMAGPGTGSVTSVAASVPAFLSISGSPITTSGTLAISYSGTALPVANGGTGITAFGTGVATALGANTNGAGGVTTTDGTKTLTNTTLDASATGNVLKQYGYLILTHPTVFGSGVTQQTTVTSPLYGQALFSNSADKATNYVEYILTVPDDIDTAVDLTGKFKFILGGADTNDHEYEISMIDVAGSAVYDTALADAVSLTYTADGSGADKDIQTAGAPDTLTGWAAALAAGNYWRIRVARDGDHASDTSTVNSYSGPLVIRYGTTQ